MRPPRQNATPVVTPVAPVRRPDPLALRPRAVRRDRAVSLLAAVLLAAFLAVAMLAGPNAQAGQERRAVHSSSVSTSQVLTI